ncbi:lipid asymmetry maintenance protein MlaB [Vibrio tapetis]|uniref:Putative Sulphate transporter/antisigma-factor antagonist STAS n=1 Tax=Vibrio tapetis subsp. tapetis TaxID=1671868 RepID=A0A2N8ZK00_9VIBR|nr:STAS domain-containing protein [Vibrio tapetis]SON52243.1 putative Sulphate transporter/antisigma-factor antagonist STAS [Vibrio tapetis subsp. tapetis]
MQCQLDESLEISNVLNSKIEYQQWLDNHELLIIDASSVSRIDAAGLQALASLFLTAKQTHTEIRLINVADKLSDGIELLALTNIFES